MNARILPGTIWMLLALGWGVGPLVASEPASAVENTGAPSKAIPLEVRVDPRVELISILFRLAGHPEYSRGRISGYASDIDKHFAPVKDHPVLPMIRQLRARRGVSYDAPMSLAVHLKDIETLELRVPLEPHPVGLDGRWRPDELKEFLEQARDFAGKGAFAAFWQDHRDLYRLTEQRARQLLEKEARLDWFNRFFGARPGARFNLVPALVNGGSCYGPRIQLDAQSEELYCILGVWRADTEGQPVFEREVLDTVVHEFCHSYVNHHIYGNAKELESAGRRLYARVEDRMRRMAYGNWETMLHESVVRASVIRYLNANNGPLAAAAQVLQESTRGFAWMPDLAELLGQYEKQRDKYADFGAFMPRIIEFFSQQAEKLGTEEEKPVPPSRVKAETVPANELSGKGRVLALDDGQAAGMRSLGGSGHAVRFEVPGEDWFLTRVEVHGARYGAAAAPREDFHVYLCDADFQVIADFPLPYTRFERGDNTWVKLAVKPTRLPAKFVVAVDFKPTASQGVYVSYDGQAGGGSLTGVPGRQFRDFTAGDWLIRALIDRK